MKRSVFTEDQLAFGAAFRQFLEKEFVPNELDWDAAGIVPRELFAEAGKHGFIGFNGPEQFGGGGVEDFRFNAILVEEANALGVGTMTIGLGLHSDIVLPYLTTYCSEEQRQRWLPGVISGETITAIAMTEPGTGSDLAGIATRAVRDGDDYVVDGSKTFITNGINADLVIVAAKTDPNERHAGLSLIVLERGMAGFERGRNLEKAGQHVQDTAELSFTNVRVPAANVLGELGQGFRYLVSNLPQERLGIAINAVASARRYLQWTVDYVQQRKAFGKPLAALQNTRFTLAECATEIDVAQAFVDQCLLAHVAGELDAVEAAKAKWWTTELASRIADRCLQLHGGYGYMKEYPISRAYVDSRVARIYGGTTEIMKEIIGKNLLP